MALQYVAALRNNQLDEIGPLIDAGSGSGVLVLYDGTQPATGGTATNEVATLVFSATSFAAAGGATVVANAIADDTNATGGTATWFRAASSNDGAAPLAAIIDGPIADLNLNSAVIGAGSSVSVTQFDISAGNP